MVPYPDIRNHGLISDRRTAGLVAADGTLDWLCLPDFDGQMLFGALLDADKGGHWRIGPCAPAQGIQVYLRDTMLLQTRWSVPQGELLLTDTMLAPETERLHSPEEARTVLRRLQCVKGTVAVHFALQPGFNLRGAANRFSRRGHYVNWNFGQAALGLWTSQPVRIQADTLEAQFDLTSGEEFWAVLDFARKPRRWTLEPARHALTQASRYWKDWLKRCRSEVMRDDRVRRSALVIHALNYAPDGSGVAAPTTSLPERIGGSWNADYRFSWVRDTSLALGILSQLGDWQETELYLRWLVKQQSPAGHPLQVLYDVRGGTRPQQRDLSYASGFRLSRPVRVGNHAYRQHQLGSLGFLADCVWSYLEHGGAWCDDYWRLIERCANYTVRNWTRRDNGLWELSKPQHFVHTKVLCWVTLDRAIKIAERKAPAFDTRGWLVERERIHRDVMGKGWSPRLRAFRQYYGGETLDAAELLIPLMGFLPAKHPRVLATIERITQHLAIDGLLFRFDPMQTPGVERIPLGEMEGAFVPCTCWLVTVLAQAGRRREAKVLLGKIEKLSSGSGLWPEAIDARNLNFLGNFPLLFSHAEYSRAKLALAGKKPRKVAAASRRCLVVGSR